MGKMKDIKTNEEETIRLSKRAERINKSNKARKKRLSKDEIEDLKWN